MTPHQKKIQIARTALLLDQPFFGVLALQLTLVEDPTCQTAWTDGRSLGYSPTFVDTLTAEELTAVIAHEVMHCACGHPWRKGPRDHRQWNIAADYAINGILTDAGFRLPKGALLDTQYAGKSSEWIYDRLPPPPPQSGQGNPDAGGTGEVRDAAPDGSTDGPTEADWQQTVQQSIQQARMRGKLPQSIARSLESLTEPRVDWRSLLRRFVQEIARADYSWTLPNRRYLASGLYLPALHSHACGRIAVAVDTSGSINQVLLRQFCSELSAIASEMEPSSIDVLYCDTKVHRVDTFTRGEPIDMHAVGGGGTSFVPVFERLATDDPPAVLIYLTDLDGAFPSAAPDYPVIWCTSTAGTAPFGDVVLCQT